MKFSQSGNRWHLSAQSKTESKKIVVEAGSSAHSILPDTFSATINWRQFNAPVIDKTRVANKKHAMSIFIPTVSKVIVTISVTVLQLSIKFDALD